jgi:hypothetical protein
MSNPTSEHEAIDTVYSRLNPEEMKPVSEVNSI